MFIYVTKERKGKGGGLRASEGDQLITRENTETSIHNMLACGINSFPALDSTHGLVLIRIWYRNAENRTQPAMY